MFRKQVIAQNLHPPMCHAATVEELNRGELLAVWYSGSFEGSKDSVLMSSRRDSDGVWQTPRVILDLPELPVGNPVLDHGPQGLTLYFVILYGTWWTEAKLARMHSVDGGRTWTHPELLRNEPGLMLRTKPLRLNTGTCLLPVYSEIDWSPLVLRSIDQGDSWSMCGDTTARGRAIQPALAELSNGAVLMYTRTNQGQIFASRSYNDGQSWTASQPVSLPNPNSGIDMLRVRSGGIVLAYNPTVQGRNNLSVSLSENEGETWGAPRTVAEGTGEFSYPTVIEDSSGHVHMVYTEHRMQIVHCEFDPEALLP
ncbi:MAG: sialidase family protein [Bacilli bacterium]